RASIGHDRELSKPATPTAAGEQRWPLAARTRRPVADWRGVRGVGGRKALVTGVSRRGGIGFAVARRVAAGGAGVVSTGWRPHDAERPWGADELSEQELARALRRDLPATAGEIHHRQDDLADSDAPAALVDAAARQLGGLDVLVAAHARSCGVPLAGSTGGELGLCWAGNVRATVLLVQEFAGGPRAEGGAGG